MGSWRSWRAPGLPRGSWANCPEGGSRAGHLVRDHRGRGTTLSGQQALGTFTRDWSPSVLVPGDGATRSSLAVPQRELHSCGGPASQLLLGPGRSRPALHRRFTEEIRGTLCSLGSVGRPERGCLFAQGGQPVVKRRRRRHLLSYLTLALFKVGAQSRDPDPEDFSQQMLRPGKPPTGRGLLPRGTPRPPGTCTPTSPGGLTRVPEARGGQPCRQVPVLPLWF